VRPPARRLLCSGCEAVRSIARRPPAARAHSSPEAVLVTRGHTLPYPPPTRRPRRRRVRVFELFPVVLAIAVVWTCGAIATAAGAYNSASADTQKYCRTDQARAWPRPPPDPPDSPDPPAALPARSGSCVFPARLFLSVDTFYPHTSAEAVSSPHRLATRAAVIVSQAPPRAGQRYRARPALTTAATSTRPAASVLYWLCAVPCTQPSACLLRAQHPGPATLTLASRSAQESVLHSSPWFRVPYPLQWGVPTFTWSSTLTMLAGALSALVESVRPGSAQGLHRVCPGCIPRACPGVPQLPGCTPGLARVYPQGLPEHACARSRHASRVVVRARPGSVAAACRAACPCSARRGCKQRAWLARCKNTRLSSAWSAGSWVTVPAGQAPAPMPQEWRPIAPLQLEQSSQRSADMRASARGRQLGDWYAAARISGAPVPPPAVISRATTVQVLRRAWPAHCCAANTGGLICMLIEASPHQYPLA
jgi:hypothetical protein